MLVKHLGKGNVFRDVASIAAGEHVADRLKKALSGNIHVLAVAGNNWEGQVEDSCRRIDDSNDWVRLELQTALNANLLVVPVLIDSRKVFAAEELPESIRSLANLNAIRVREDPDFEQDVRRVLHAVGWRWWHSGRTWALTSVIALTVLVGVASGPVLKQQQLHEWNDLMVANFNLGQWDAAEVAADRILVREPRHLRALSLKGSVAALSGQFRTAVKYFGLAYEVDPKNRVVRRNLAYAYLHTGRAADAVRLYELLRDGSAAAEYSVACAYLGAKRYSDALRVLDGLPTSQASNEDKSPVGQVPVLYAAALMGRAGRTDRATAINKLIFGISQSPAYWTPILAQRETDPQNDYSQQIELLKPIIGEALNSTKKRGGAPSDISPRNTQ